MTHPEAFETFERYFEKFKTFLRATQKQFAEKNIDEQNTLINQQRYYLCKVTSEKIIPEIEYESKKKNKPWGEFICLLDLMQSAIEDPNDTTVLQGFSNFLENKKQLNHDAKLNVLKNKKLAAGIALFAAVLFIGAIITAAYFLMPLHPVVAIAMLTIPLVMVRALTQLAGKRNDAQKEINALKKTPNQQASSIVRNASALFHTALKFKYVAENAKTNPSAAPPPSPAFSR